MPKERFQLDNINSVFAGNLAVPVLFLYREYLTRVRHSSVLNRLNIFRNCIVYITKNLHLYVNQALLVFRAASSLLTQLESAKTPHTYVNRTIYDCRVSYRKRKTLSELQSFLILSDNGTRRIKTSFSSLAVTNRFVAGRENV